MSAPTERLPRSLSARRIYLDSLRAPTATESNRITSIQLQKEDEIDSRYHAHSQQEHNAVTKIQAAYRGHRDRRQLEGLTLDPSSRWLEIFNELKLRSITAPDRQATPGASKDRARASSDAAKKHWRKAGWVAEHAGRGESPRPGSSASNMSGKDSGISDEDHQKAGTMLMDLRYFLEMVDQKHRYGANLQVYHEFWQREKTSQNFFRWLDHGAGRELDLPMCSRTKLDSERIRYLSKEERKDYLVQVDPEGCLRWAKNGQMISTNADTYQDSAHGIVPFGTEAPISGVTPSGSAPSDDDAGALHRPSTSSSEDDRDVQLSAEPVSQSKKPPRKHFHVSPATILNHLLRASVKPGTWIYVADTVGRLYISIKSSGAFQHASFLSGARISSAGSIGVENGKLSYLSPLSGHYRPTTKSFRDFLVNLDEQGVDMSHLKVSGAYKVLRGMEFYGKTKKGLGKVAHPKSHEERARAPPSPKSKERKALGLLHETEAMSATDLVQRHWDEERRRKS